MKRRPFTQIDVKYFEFIRSFKINFSELSAANLKAKNELRDHQRKREETSHGSYTEAEKLLIRYARYDHNALKFKARNLMITHRTLKARYKNYLDNRAARQQYYTNFKERHKALSTKILALKRQISQKHREQTTPNLAVLKYTAGEISLRRLRIELGTIKTLHLKLTKCRATLAAMELELKEFKEQARVYALSKSAKEL